MCEHKENFGNNFEIYFPGFRWSNYSVLNGRLSQVICGGEISR
jgi:hypothetical protein